MAAKQAYGVQVSIATIVVCVERNHTSRAPTPQISATTRSRYTGISRDKIRTALSLLVTHATVHVDHIPSGTSKYGVSNAYRIPHIRSHVHMGTSAREQLENAAVAEEAVPFQPLPATSHLYL
jgi:hypothetical protein